MYKEELSKRSAYQPTSSTEASNTAGLGFSKGPEVSALEQIAQRIASLADRLDNTNLYTLSFLERIVGTETDRDEPPTLKVSSEHKSAIGMLQMLLDRLEYQVIRADNHSCKLGSIG